MPGPLVLLGFGFLGSVLGKLFTSAVEVLTKYVTKKVAVRVIVAGTIVFMFGLMVATLEGVLALIPLAMPAGYGTMLSYILPWNTSTCLSAVITARIARHVYDSNVKLVQWSLPGF